MAKETMRKRGLPTDASIPETFVSVKRGLSYGKRDLPMRKRGLSTDTSIPDVCPSAFIGLFCTFVGLFCHVTGLF